MPASQCGSLIGKGGAKIKEIREVGGLPVARLIDTARRVGGRVRVTVELVVF